jgi:hypothetical protein
MPEIILTEEQARILREAKEPVILHDTDMTVRVVSEPPDAVALANHHRRKVSGANCRGVSGERIQAMFQALQAEEARRPSYAPSAPRKLRRSSIRRMSRD